MRWLCLCLLACSPEPPAQKTVVIRPTPAAEPGQPVNTFYKYKGAHGVWSYADSLSMIPEKYRASAVRLDLPGAKPGEGVKAREEEAKAPAAPAPEPAKPIVAEEPAPGQPATAKKKDAPKERNDASRQKQAEELLQKAKALEHQATERANALTQDQGGEK